jgi:hypothetical protein
MVQVCRSSAVSVQSIFHATCTYAAAAHTNASAHPCAIVSTVQLVSLSRRLHAGEAETTRSVEGPCSSLSYYWCGAVFFALRGASVTGKKCVDNIGPQLLFSPCSKACLDLKFLRLSGLALRIEAVIKT